MPETLESTDLPVPQHPEIGQDRMKQLETKAAELMSIGKLEAAQEKQAYLAEKKERSEERPDSMEIAKKAGMGGMILTVGMLMLPVFMPLGIIAMAIGAYLAMDALVSVGDKINDRLSSFSENRAAHRVALEQLNTPQMIQEFSKEERAFMRDILTTPEQNRHSVLSTPLFDMPQNPNDPELYEDNHSSSLLLEDGSRLEEESEIDGDHQYRAGVNNPLYEQGPMMSSMMKLDGGHSEESSTDPSPHIPQIHTSSPLGSPSQTNHEARTQQLNQERASHILESNRNAATHNPRGYQNLNGPGR